jgi:hypothetical protein
MNGDEVLTENMTTVWFKIIGTRSAWTKQMTNTQRDNHLHGPGWRLASVTTTPLGDEQILTHTYRCLGGVEATYTTVTPRF